MEAHVNGHRLRGAAAAGDDGGRVGVVEEGPGNEAAGVDLPVVRQRPVRAAVHVLLRATRAGRAALAPHLVVAAAPDIPAWPPPVCILSNISQTRTSLVINNKAIACYPYELSCFGQTCGPTFCLEINLTSATGVLTGHTNGKNLLPGQHRQTLLSLFVSSHNGHL